MGPWLHRIVLNVGRNHVRKRVRRRSLLERFSPRRPNPPQPPTIRSELTRQALWRAVGDLPALQQQVLLLRIVDGLSTAEAAEALGRAQGTVKASLFRALSTLRNHFDDDG